MLKGFGGVFFGDFRVEGFILLNRVRGFFSFWEGILFLIFRVLVVGLVRVGLRLLLFVVEGRYFL